MFERLEEDQEQNGSEPTSGEQNPDPAGTSEGSQKSSKSPAGQGSAQVEDLSVQPGPGARNFNHPLLRGKSDEEIERLFSVQEQAVREQNAELNRRFSREQEAAQPQKQEEAPGDDGYGDDFLAPRFRVLEKRLSQQLQNELAPLRKSQESGQSRDAREGLRGRLKHFNRLEPYIDQLLRERGMDPTRTPEDVLANIYHTAVGLAVDRGIDLNESVPAPQGRQERQQEQQPVNIPQHRASSAPLPSSGQRESNVRPLSEYERRLAHEYFPKSKGFKDPEAEYRKYQDMNDDDVVEPGFSKGSW